MIKSETYSYLIKRTSGLCELLLFNTLTLKQILWKKKTFFKKLEYSFLVETTNIENTSFPFKTALREANVKTNRMTTTKLVYHKEWSFASNYFIFWKICFSFNFSFSPFRANLMCQRSKWNLILRSFFLVSILNMTIKKKVVIYDNT